MYAVEFETNITSPFIHLQSYEQFLNQQVKVIVLSEKDQETTKLKPDLSHIQRLRQRKFAVPANVDIDAIMSEMNHGLS